MKTRMAALCLAMMIFMPQIIAQKSMSVELGIFQHSGNVMLPLKSYDRVRPADQIKIIVHPVSECYAYIIHSDGKRAQLLGDSSAKHFRYEEQFKLPPEGYYTIDGSSDYEYFTFILSVNRIEEFENLFADGKTISHFRWNQIDLLLSALHRNAIYSVPEKPMSMAGNTRDGGEYRQQLRAFMGDNIIMKHYVLEVKR